MRELAQVALLTAVGFLQRRAVAFTHFVQTKVDGDVVASHRHVTLDDTKGAGVFPFLRLDAEALGGQIGQKGFRIEHLGEARDRQIERCDLRDLVSCRRIGFDTDWNRDGIQPAGRAVDGDDDAVVAAAIRCSKRSVASQGQRCREARTHREPRDDGKRAAWARRTHELGHLSSLN